MKLNFFPTYRRKSRYPSKRNKKLKSKLVLQIHDELLIETKEDEVEEVRKILKEEMMGAADLKVPLSIDIEEGKTWYEAK